MGSADCEAIALMGVSRMLSTARPKNKNMLHTCWINLFVLASTRGDVDGVLVYFLVAPYFMGVCGNGWCCSMMS